MPVKSAFLSARSRFSTDLDRASSWRVSAVGTSTVALLGIIWQPRRLVKVNKPMASRVFRLAIVFLLRQSGQFGTTAPPRSQPSLLHLITLSALASTFGGIVRPI